MEKIKLHAKPLLTIQDYLRQHYFDITCIGIDHDNCVYSINLGSKFGKYKQTTLLECKRDAPVYPHPYSKKLPPFDIIHPDEREFIQTIQKDTTDLEGSTLILKPDWFNSGKVPGTKIFKLVKHRPAYKWIDSKILRKEPWSLETPHCDQKDFPRPVFELILLSLEEVNEISKFHELCNKLLLTYDNTSVSDWIIDQGEYKKFIITVDSNNNLSGSTLKYYFEADEEDAIIEGNKFKSEWKLGMTRSDIEIPGGRELLQIDVSNLVPSEYKEVINFKSLTYPVNIVKPEWFDSDLVPGTKFFRLKEQIPSNASKQFRVNSDNEIQKPFNRPHKSEYLRVFELIPLSLEEINELAETKLSKPLKMWNVGGKRNKSKKKLNKTIENTRRRTNIK